MPNFDLEAYQERAKSAKYEEEKAAERVRTLAEAAKAAEEAMRAALAAGDAEEYKLRREDREAAEEAILALRNEGTAQNLYEIREEARQAWNKYADSYNKTFAAKYEAYKKDRAKLCRNYYALAEMQRQALNNQNETMVFLEDPSGMIELTLLEQAAPEIDFLSKGEMPGHSFGLAAVIRSRSAIDAAKMDDSNVDPRILAYMRL